MAKSRRKTTWAIQVVFSLYRRCGIGEAVWLAVGIGEAEGAIVGATLGIAVGTIVGASVGAGEVTPIGYGEVPPALHAVRSITAESERRR